MTINCNGQLIDLSVPKVMGILNVTPDSFYDGGKNTQIDQAITHTHKMLSEGATFIDIGGYSSRPGATDISPEEEAARVLPVIRVLVQEFPEILISVDTFRASVAQKAVQAGAVMVNDISAGLLDENMLTTVSDLAVPYCMMHMKGSPQTMKELAHYEDVTKEVTHYFSDRIAAARAAKINDIIIDPGFGFAKTVAQNYELLAAMEQLQFLDVPVLAGLSRKSMIYKVLGVTSSEALNGTTALHMVALQKGAHILRVHDVKEAMECVQLFDTLSRK